MTSTAILIFPHQLFPLAHWRKWRRHTFFLIEDPLFFGQREIRLHFNRLKLIYHRASMQFFYHQMTAAKYNIHYISLTDNPMQILASYTKKIAYYPADRLLQERWRDVKYVDTPYFLLSSSHMEQYRIKHGTRQRFVHREFYHFVKQKLNLLTDVKSQDEDNRQPLPPDYICPTLPIMNNVKEQSYLEDAEQYIRQHFPHAPGPDQFNPAEFLFPIGRRGTLRALRHFIRDRFAKFGPYEDAMSTSSIAIHHSLLSTPINIGLITPKEVVKEIMSAKVDMQSKEGFIRQLIGWREYSRMLYELAYDAMKQANCFSHQRRLSSDWYRGTTGIDPLDITIRKAFHHGYLHHIERLMIVANLMNLCEICPDDAYRWFMEFSCDSYDWVMVNNVYSMGLWADAGLTMRKPYVSSPAYVLKMSDFIADDRWVNIWRGLYYTFIEKNREQIKGTPLIYNIGYWRRLPEAERSRLEKLARRQRSKVGRK